MRLLVEITIPPEATIEDVNAVVEFCEGVGEVRLNLAGLKIGAAIEPSDQPVMDISAALVTHTRQEIEAIVQPALVESGHPIRERLTEAISAGFGLLDRWDEILTEVQSRGWDRPSWEIRA